MGLDEDRFWSYVARGSPSDCWPWLGAKKGPYGQFSMGGQKGRSAHVVAWEIENGPIPKGMYGLHLCHNPNCVNPAHVAPGTQKENVQASVELRTHRNSRKTHCKYGHELTEDNIYRKPGRPHVRNCLTCIRLRKGK